MIDPRSRFTSRMDQLKSRASSGGPEIPVARVDGPGSLGEDQFQPFRDLAGDFQAGTINRDQLMSGAKDLLETRDRAGSPGVVMGSPNVQGKSVGAQKMIDRMNTFEEVAPGEYKRWRPEYQPGGRIPGPVSPGVVVPPSPLPPTPSVDRLYTPVREYDNGTTMYYNQVSGYLYWEGPDGERAEYQPNHDRLWVDGEQVTSYPSWLPQESRDIIRRQGGMK